MLENSVQTHARLNGVRAALGLPARPSATFNLFIDEADVIAPFRTRWSYSTSRTSAPLHDLLLYAVEPQLGDGEVHYDSALLSTVTDALLALGADAGSRLPFGQNRLWVWERQ